MASLPAMRVQLDVFNKAFIEATEGPGGNRAAYLQDAITELESSIHFAERSQFKQALLQHDYYLGAAWAGNITQSASVEQMRQMLRDAAELPIE